MENVSKIKSIINRAFGNSVEKFLINTLTND